MKSQICVHPMDHFRAIGEQRSQSPGGKHRPDFPLFSVKFICDPLHNAFDQADIAPINSRLHCPNRVGSDDFSWFFRIYFWQLCRGLVQRLEAEPDTWIVADGNSCRRQILDGTGREAIHPAVALARALSAAEA